MKQHIPVSLCLIVRDEEKKIKTCLDSVHQFVDEILITDTGSTDETKKVLAELPYAGKIKVSDFNPKTNPEAFFEDGKIKDFAAARNFNFKQASHKWIIWMDADDVYRGIEYLQSLLAIADERSVDGYYLHYWYTLDEKGNPLENHKKLMIARNDGTFSWKGRVHEDLLPEPGRVRNLGENSQIVRIHAMGNADPAAKSARNLRILMDELNEQGDNPDARTLFYTARALIALGGRWTEAAECLEKYLELSGWVEEVREALYLLGECYIETRQLDKARVCAYKAMDAKPENPDAYFQLARILSLEEDWERAREWCELGFSRKIDKDAITFMPQRYTVMAPSVYAVILMNLGKIEEAKKYADQAVKNDPKNKGSISIQNLINYLNTNKTVTKSYANIAAYMKAKGEEWRIKELLGTVHPDLDANPIIAKLKYDFMPPVTWPKKSIAILAFGAVEAWSPLNEKKGGIGGSEEAILNLSRELKKLGYNVTVYTNTGKDDGEYEGVKWEMYTKFNGKDEFDTIVIWRATGMLEYKLKANKVLFDMHDVPQIGDWEKGRPDKVNAIMVKSNYHRNLLPEVEDEKFAIVGNGIKPEHFQHKVTRKPFRCIYSSAIDRGLDLLLDMWPQIHAEVPDAELHIYYGFQTFKALNKHNPERMRYCDRIEQKMIDLQPLGVYYHGRVDHETLAKEFLASDLWLYPTYFPEISCITAMKAQASGAIPVCTDFAALDETVQYGKKIKGDIYLPEVQEEFIKTTVDVLKDTKYKEETRDKMMPWAMDKFAWANVAKAWAAVIDGGTS